MIILFDQTSGLGTINANSKPAGRRIGPPPEGNGRRNPAEKQKTETVKP